jgi:cysteine synthase A
MSCQFEFGRTCGNTPLVKITEKLYAKLETFNPTGSVKDRMISYVVDKAIRTGQFSPGSIVCEATSGNSGISLAAVAASMGSKCVIFMPSNMSEERKQMMRIYGAEVVEAPPSDFEAAIRMRDEFLVANPGSWSPMQFSNPDNVECHKSITAPEISARLWLMGTKWSAYIHGSGTGGTLEGVRQYVRNDSGFLKNNGKVNICMVVPAESPHGIQGIADGRDFLAKREDMDDVLIVTTDEALQRAKAFAKKTGLLVGISSGANLVASERWIAANNPDGIVVTMLCDRGERYMSLYI